MHSELLQRCPAFAGTSRSVPHSGFNATKRPLSQPSMEFADTPASYDLQGRFGSSFAMLAQQRPASPPGLTFGHRSVPSSSKSGAKSAGGGTSKTGGLSDSGNMRQPRPGSPGTFDPVSGLPNSSAFLSVARGGPQALRTDIGSATRAASKGAQGGGQVQIGVLLCYAMSLFWASIRFAGIFNEIAHVCMFSIMIVCRRLECTCLYASTLNLISHKLLHLHAFIC
jgi:hypothetical protein